MANDVVSRHDFSTCCDFDPVSDARSFLLVLENTEEKDAKKMLDGKNIKIARSLVGNYCTSLEMQGASVTLTKLDQELVKHWDSAVHTAAMRWGM